MMNEEETQNPSAEAAGRREFTLLCVDGGIRIKVKPEGRDGIWEADKESVVDFLLQYKKETIHNFNPGGPIITGADWSIESVVEKVRDAERLAIMTGDAFEHNLRHSLAVIVSNKLHMFDIGSFDT